MLQGPDNCPKTFFPLQKIQLEHRRPITAVKTVRLLSPKPSENDKLDIEGCGCGVNSGVVFLLTHLEVHPRSV